MSVPALPGTTPLPALRVAADLPEDAVVVAVLTRPADDGQAAEGDAAPVEVLGSAPQDAPELMRRGKATGKAGEVVGVPVLSGGALERVLLVGTGDGQPGDARKAGAALARKARDAALLAVDLRGLAVVAGSTAALVEGLLLASYAFTLKPGAEPRALTEIVLVGGLPEDEVRRSEALARATALARDLVNTPAREACPSWVADVAASSCSDLEVRVRDEQELAAEGFGGILGVGQGSSRPPRLVTVTHAGSGDGPHVVLVGKGITFDTGGLSLKPNDSMLSMKTDMGGAAAVLGAVRAAADLDLPVRVTALLCLAENMPSGDAQRPGDVLTQYGGRTVEVLNTDAEGRLVLADGLVHADRDLQADVIVDVATLTGAMPVALGRRTAGFFSSDDALAAQLEQASADSGERVWRLPLVQEYRHALESPVADLRNIGNPRLKLQGGSITAALFLQEFTGGRPWAHVDIAGTAATSSEDDELVKGATGFGVRLLVRWLEGLAAR